MNEALGWEVLKWKKTIQQAISKVLVYRLNFVLFVVGPTLVFFLIRYQLWTTIYSGSEKALKGFTYEQMMEYQLLVLVISYLATGHRSMNMAFEIRMGRVSTHLVYPFGFWRYYFCEYLGFLAVSIVTSHIALLVGWGLGVITSLSFSTYLAGLCFSFLVGVFWYFCQFGIGLISFWLEETWMLRVVLILISDFFSGSIIPLAFFPEWLRKLVDFSPFPLLAHYPIALFRGEVDQALPLFGMLIFWITVAMAGSYFIWRQGIKHYSGAGA